MTEKPHKRPNPNPTPFPDDMPDGLKEALTRLGNHTIEDWQADNISRQLKKEAIMHERKMRSIKTEHELIWDQRLQTWVTGKRLP